MKTFEKVSDFVGKYMAAIVIVVAALSLLFPGTFSVVKTAWVNTLLGIVMCGMGLTLKPEDFKVVFSRPKDVIIGCVAQFTLMPFLAWALTQVFHHHPRAVQLPSRMRLKTTRASAILQALTSFSTFIHTQSHLVQILSDNPLSA